MTVRQLLVLILFIAAVFACNPSRKDAASMETASSQYSLPDPTAFNREVGGKTTKLFLLTNGKGLQAAVTNYGARMVSLIVPDKNAHPTDVLQGYASIDGYLQSNEVYFGAIVGRYGNRIAKGKFILNGKSYTLATNNAPNHLHGGPKGFHAVVWEGKQLDSSAVELRYRAADGEEGYPGNLDVTVVYRLMPDNTVECQISATTDQPTIVNLTNHNFWNLDGERDSTINDHLLQIFADRFIPVDSTLIPLGQIAPVSGTPFDFQQPTAIGSRVNEDYDQLKFGLGYDHNFVLKPVENPGGLPLAARVTGPASGITLEIFTQEPGLQFYGGNFLKGLDKGKSGIPYVYRSSFCLETQHYPDSPNQPQFPSTVLSPGKTYSTRTVWKFSAK